MIYKENLAALPRLNALRFLPALDPSIRIFLKALRSNTGSCALAYGSKEMAAFYPFPGFRPQAAFILGYSLIAPAGALVHRLAKQLQNFKPVNGCSTVSGYQQTVELL